MPKPTTTTFLVASGHCFVLVICCYLGFAVKCLLHFQLSFPFFFCFFSRTATQGMATPSVFPGVTMPTTVTSAPLIAPAGLPATAPGAPPISFPSSCAAGSGSPLFQPASFQQQGSPMKAPEISLANVHVPLESIKPSEYLRFFTFLWTFFKSKAYEVEREDEMSQQNSQIA